MSLYKYNFRNEYITDREPVEVMNVLTDYKAEVNTELKITENLDKKCIILDDASRNL